MGLTSVIVNVAMTGMGDDVPYTIPDNVSSITIRPMGGNVYEYNDASGGDDFPYLDAEAFTIETRGAGGTVLLFRGGAGVILKIKYFTGIL